MRVREHHVQCRTAWLEVSRGSTALCPAGPAAADLRAAFLHGSLSVCCDVYAACTRLYYSRKTLLCVKDTGDCEESSLLSPSSHALCSCNVSAPLCGRSAEALYGCP